MGLEVWIPLEKPIESDFAIDFVAQLYNIHIRTKHLPQLGIR